MVSKIPRKSIADTSHVHALGTTRHEQASAALSSVLLLLGVMTAGMLVVWLASTMTWKRPVTPPIPVDVGGGFNGDSLTGGDKELLIPGPEEVRGVLEEERTAQPLESITSLVSAEIEPWDAMDSWYVKKRPIGDGMLDGIPAWDRWEIKFESTDLEKYAQQLDFFQVELGVAGGGIDMVDYCSNLSARLPDRRAGPPTLEKRLFFLHKAGHLRQADRALAQKAGIDVTDRVVFQFYPREMYVRLLTLENLAMGRRRIIDVKRTTFGVRGTTPGQWEFHVLKQQYRGPLPFKS